MVFNHDPGRFSSNRSTNDDEPEPATSSATSLIVSIALPAYSIDEQISFHVKPSCHEKVIDGVEDIVHAIASDLQSELISVDKDGTQRKMDHLRKRALDDAKDWQEKLKQVDEWKMKVKRANEKMNTMRDAYFKELFHLREQVYQQKKAEKDGTGFNPSYAMHFDPSDYHTDEQVISLVNDKVSLIQQEYATKFSELDQKYASRIKSLNDQVCTSKLLLTRKDKLLKKAESTLKTLQKGAAAPIDGRSAETHATEEFLEVDAGKTAVAEEALNESERFYKFLEHKYGSLKEAKINVGLKRRMDESLGVSEFREWMNEMGYKCDAAKVFAHLTAGATSAHLHDFLERPAERRNSRELRRMSANIEHLPESTLKEVENPKPAVRRRHSVGTAPSMSSNTVADLVSKPKESTVPDSSSLKVQELDEMSDLVDDDLSAFEGDSDDGSGSDTRTLRSQATTMTRRTSSSKKGRRNSVDNARVVAKAATIFSRMAKPTSRHQRKDEKEIMTSVHYDSGIQAAFSASNAIPEMAEKMVDTGTDALPYQAAFPKVKLRSCGTQSQIDGRMLDKAMDFYDNLAEDNWNALAGIMMSDSESEEEKEAQAAGPQKDAGGADAAAGTAEVAADKMACSDTGGSGEGPGAAPGESGDEKSSGRNSRNPSKDARGTRAKYTSNQIGKSVGAWNFLEGVQRVEQRVQTFADFGAIERGVVSLAAKNAFQNSAQVRNGRSEALATLPEPSLFGSRMARPKAETSEAEIQCGAATINIDLLSPLEKWFPDEEDPVDVQIQQIIDMANEMEERIPELKSRADVLAGQLTRGSGEREKKLIEQLNRLRFAPIATKANANILETGAHARDAAPKLSSGAKAAPSVEDLLARHGIVDNDVQDIDIDMGRHTHGGASSTTTQKRSPPVAPSAGMPRRASGQFRMSRPPPVKVLNKGHSSGEKLGESLRSGSTSPSNKEPLTAPLAGHGRRNSSHKTQPAMAPVEGSKLTSSTLTASSAGDRAQQTPSPNPLSANGDRCLRTPSPNPLPGAPAAAEKEEEKDSDFGDDSSDGEKEADLVRKRPAQTAATKKKTMDATQLAVERARRKSNERIEMATEADKGNAKADTTPTSAENEPAKLQDGWSGLNKEQAFTSRGVLAEKASDTPSPTAASQAASRNAQSTAASDAAPVKPLRRLSTTTLSLNANSENAGVSEQGADDPDSGRFTFTGDRTTDNGRTSMMSEERVSRVTFSDVGSPRDTGNASNTGARQRPLRNLPGRQRTRELLKGKADEVSANERTTDASNTSRHTENSNRLTRDSYTDNACLFSDGDDLGLGIEDTLLEEFTTDNKQESKPGARRQLGWSQGSQMPSSMPGGMRVGAQGPSSSTPEYQGEHFRKLPSIATATAASSSSSSPPAAKVAGQTMSLAQDVGADLRVRPGVAGELPAPARRGSAGTGEAKAMPFKLSKVPGDAAAKSPRAALLKQKTQESVEGRNTAPASSSTTKSPRKDDEVPERRTFEAKSVGSFDPCACGEEELLKDLDERFNSNHSVQGKDISLPLGNRFNSNKSEVSEVDSDCSPKASKSTSPGGKLSKGLSLMGTQASAKSSTPRTTPKDNEKPPRPFRRMRP